MRCTNCGTDNLPTNQFCANCGTPLSVAPQPNQPVKRSAGRTILIIGGVGLAVVLLACIACFVLVLLSGGSRSRTSTVADAPDIPAQSAIPIATAATILTSVPANTTTPKSPTPALLSYKEIEDTFNKMTDIQRESYLPTIIGKRVHWSGKIRDVKADGSVTLDMKQSLFYSITLTALPKDVAARLNRDQTIEFDATITNAKQTLGLDITLKLIALTN